MEKKPKGRPKKENANTCNISVKFNSELLERLNQYCKRSGKLRGLTIRKAVEIYLDSEESRPHSGEPPNNTE